VPFDVNFESQDNGKSVFSVFLMPSAGQIVQLSRGHQGRMDHRMRTREASQLTLAVAESAQSVHFAYSSDLLVSCRAQSVR